jgi:hypothetical protein
MPRLVTAGWDDVPHLTADEKAVLLASIPPHQRDARTKGVPMLGAGAVYPFDETTIAVEPFPVPGYFARGYGFDVGWNWTAAVFVAHDRDTDVAYIYDVYKRSQAEPVLHAAAIKARGDWLPGAIDPASRGRGQSDGKKLLALYEEAGLILSIADNAVGAGISEVWQRLSTGRLRVFTTCRDWFQEFRIYRRNEAGKIVKTNDHLMDAMRYRLMDMPGMISESEALYGGHRRIRYLGDTR